MVACLLTTTPSIAQVCLTMPELLQRLKPTLNKVPVADKALLISLIRPTIGYGEMRRSDDSIAVGQSKFGGRPDLPVGFLWPIYKEEHMAFCVQYNLAEASSFDIDQLLPKLGLLSVFIAIDKKCPCFYEQGKTFRLVYSPDTASLKRTDFPTSYLQDAIFRPARIVYFQYYTMPGREGARFAKFSKQRMAAFNNVSEAVQLLSDSTSGLHLPNMPQFPTHNFHQLLGYDRPIQASALSYVAWDVLGLHPLTPKKLKANQAKLEATEDAYIILMQVDCGSGYNDLSKYGSDCVIYIAIKPDDLKNHRFDRAVMVTQCT